MIWLLGFDFYRDLASAEHRKLQSDERIPCSSPSQFGFKLAGELDSRKGF